MFHSVIMNLANKLILPNNIKDMIYMHNALN